MAAVLALLAMAVLAALMFTRMHAEVIDALGPGAGGTAIIIGLTLAVAGDVLRDELDVSGHQIVQRLWRFLLVERILLDGFIERRQVLMKFGFPGASDELVVPRQRDGQQDRGSG